MTHSSSSRSSRNNEIIIDEDIDLEKNHKKESSLSKRSRIFSRNEKVYMHSILLFKLSYPYLNRQSKEYQESYDKFIYQIRYVCNIPDFDYRRKAFLLEEANKNCERYSHTLHIAVLNTGGIENLADHERGDRVFVYFIGGGVKTSLEIYQINGKWMPWCDAYGRNSEILKIHPKSVNPESEFTLQIVINRIVTIKDALLATVGVYSNKIIVGTHSQKFSSLDPQDQEFEISFQYMNVVVKATLRLQLVLKVSLLKGGYYYFTKIQRFHQEIVEQFLRWRERCGKEPHQCIGQSKQKAAIVPQSLIPSGLRKHNDGFKVPYTLSHVAHFLHISSEKDMKTYFHNPDLFCVCNEWCNLHSFYYHNTLARFVLCQNQKLFVVPKNLIIPYHFLAVSNLISQKNSHCIGIFKSCIQLIKEYLKEINEDELSTLKKYFWDTYAGGLIREAYFNIRQWLVGNETFKIVKRPFDYFSNDFLCFVKEILWLSSVSMEMKDIKLVKKLRFKFQDILIYWIKMVLNNPPLAISTRLMIFDYFMSSDGQLDFSVKAVSPITKSSSSGKVFVRKSLLMIVKERDRKDETEEQLKKSLEKTKVSKFSKCIVECSHTLSLIHKIHDFLLHANHLIPFYPYDDELYRSESKLAFKIDYNFAQKIKDKSELKVVIRKGSDDDGSKEVIFIHYYLVILYSVALDIQNFIINHISYTFREEFQFEYPLDKVSFFISNNWIENITKTSLKDLPFNRVFKDTEQIKATVDAQFNLFYNKYWNPISIDDKKVESDIFIYDCICFAKWFQHCRDPDNAIVKSEQELINIISECVSNSEMYLELNLSEIKTDTWRSEDVIKCRQLLTKYTIKAFFYNMVSIAAIIAQKCLSLLNENQSKNFVGIFPAWIPLFSLHDKIKQELEGFTRRHQELIDDRTMKHTQPILKHINSIFCLVYVQLSNAYSSYISKLNNEKLTLKLLLLIAFPMLKCFKSSFVAVHKFVLKNIDKNTPSRLTVKSVESFMKKHGNVEFRSELWQQAFKQHMTKIRSKYTSNKLIKLSDQWNVKNNRDH